MKFRLGSTRFNDAAPQERGETAGTT
ncbi:hypothetical protein RA210_U70158 [Rubrivivax sp. A210]|nr:hypothetical protein RA210_U70158 [Rubrivivax sp. A210]